MSRLRCTITTEAEIALTAATAKTILQLAAPANQRAAIVGVGVFFDGINAAGEPVQVELLKQTDAGTMSSATEVVDNGGAETPQSVGQRNASVEPTPGAIHRRYNIHPQTGIERVYGPDEEIIVAGGERIALRCTAPVGVNVTGFISWEE